MKGRRGNAQLRCIDKNATAVDKTRSGNRFCLRLLRQNVTEMRRDLAPRTSRLAMLPMIDDRSILAYVHSNPVISRADAEHERVRGAGSSLPRNSAGLIISRDRGEAVFVPGPASPFPSESSFLSQGSIDRPGGKARACGRSARGLRSETRLEPDMRW